MHDKVVFRLNKLVRDKLPNMMEELGQLPEVTTLSGLELKQALIRKIAEELSELDPEADDYQKELADLNQAVKDLNEISGGEETIEAIRHELLDKKGGFRSGQYITNLALSRDDEWVEYYREEPERYPERSLD